MFDMPLISRRGLDSLPWCCLLLFHDILNDCKLCARTLTEKTSLVLSMRLTRRRIRIHRPVAACLCACTKTKANMWHQKCVCPCTWLIQDPVPYTTDHSQQSQQYAW